MSKATESRAITTETGGIIAPFSSDDRIRLKNFFDRQRPYGITSLAWRESAARPLRVYLKDTLASGISATLDVAEKNPSCKSLIEFYKNGRVYNYDDIVFNVETDPMRFARKLYADFHSIVAISPAPLIITPPLRAVDGRTLVFRSAEGADKKGDARKVALKVESGSDAWRSHFNHAAPPRAFIYSPTVTNFQVQDDRLTIDMQVQTGRSTPWFTASPRAA